MFESQSGWDATDDRVGVRTVSIRIEISIGAARCRLYPKIED